MKAVPTWLERARSAADRPPALPRVPLRLDAEDEPVVVGSIEPGIAARAQAAGLPMREWPDGAGWHLHGPADAALARLAAWLRDAGLAARWRDELLAVEDAQGRVVGAVERAACRVIGITTHAVHLAGFDRRGRAWVQQRAFDKATDPGLWDTLVGGQVAHGEAVRTSLERETMEEAGLALDRFDGLAFVGRLVVRRPVDEGYLVERLDAWVATLADDATPVNRDGEVVRFERLERGALEARLADGAFTLEASLVLGAVLASSRPA